MANEAMKEMLHELLQELAQQREDMSTLQQRLAAVMGTAKSTNDLVTAWVNARGILIQLQFHPDALERAGGLDALGRHITQATQKAAQEVKLQIDEILGPMRDRVKAMPQLSEMFPGIPDIDDYIPEPVEPSTEPPFSPERQTPVDDDDEYYESLEQRPTPGGPLGRAW